MDSPQHQQQQQQQHRHRQEVPSKETSVCTAPLHHAIVKPEGLESNTYSHPETFSGAETTRTNSFSLSDMEGKQRRKWSPFFGELRVTRFYVLPPAYREASLWPSLHLHSSRMLQNRSPEGRGRTGKMEKGKEGESKRR